jgi:hypothetical protein
MTTKRIVIAAFATIMWLSMILPSNIFAQGTFEDDGDILSDDPEQAQQEEEQHAKNYDDNDLPKYDPDTGTYNDDDNNGIDDDSKSNDNNELPRCKYLVVQDCVINDLGQTCEVGTGDDPCQDVYYGYKGSRYEQGETIKDSGPTNDVGKDTNSDGKDDTNTPYCDIVHDYGLSYSGPCWDRKDYDQNTGLYPCRDGTSVTDWRSCK